MAQIEDLNTAIAALATEVAGDTDAMQKTVALLDEMHAQLAAVTQAPDLSTAIVGVQQAQTALAAGRESLSAALGRDAPTSGGTGA